MKPNEEELNHLGCTRAEFNRHELLSFIVAVGYVALILLGLFY